MCNRRTCDTYVGYRKEVALAGDILLHPFTWGEEAGAGSAAGRGRAGVETASEQEPW